MKTAKSVKIDDQAVEVFRRLVMQLPVVGRVAVRSVAPDPVAGIAGHFVFDVVIAGGRQLLIGIVSRRGEPGFVRVGLLELQRLVAHRRGDGVAILIAPYLSPEARALCRDFGAGWLDFEGNVLITFGGVFIERQVATKPAVERRALRSLFRPRSAQVLRVLLRKPEQSWRVAHLAEVAGASLGHVSNVRAGLLEREWAHVTASGFCLSAPDALIDAWRGAYERPTGKRLAFYTPMHGGAFSDAVRNLSFMSGVAGGRIALASFSAAQWHAPYGRTGTHYFHADAAGLERLMGALKLSTSAQGENVVVTVLENDDLFRDMVEPAPGIFTTSPVQTYLDLAASGERGQEAAEHLRREKLSWRR